MCAFFGSYMGIVPSSKTIMALPSTSTMTVDAKPPLLAIHSSSMSAGSSSSSSRRRRRLLTTNDQTENNTTSSGMMHDNSKNINMENKNTDDKAIALWQNILHDMKTPVKYPISGVNSDVKQLLFRIGNFSTSKSHNMKKVNKAAAATPVKRKLRARRRRENFNSTIVPYSQKPDDADTVTNASFMLCPKPYGSLAHSDSQVSQYGAGTSFEKVPNTFMYDDVKVNRDLVLLMPSTSLGGKMGLGRNNQWDGQWVQVDAVVKSVKPAMGLSGFKAIAGSQ